DGQGAFADRRGETFSARAVTHIHCHRSAAFVEALRRGPPEPAPGAGDDDNASGKVLRCPLPAHLNIRASRLLQRNWLFTADGDGPNENKMRDSECFRSSLQRMVRCIHRITSVSSIRSKAVRLGSNSSALHLSTCL